MPTPSSAASPAAGIAGLLDLDFAPDGDPAPLAASTWVGRRRLDDLDVPGLPATHDVPLLVTVTGGAGQVAGAARITAGRDALLVVPLRDLDDLAANARRVCAAVAGEVEEERVLLGLPAGEPRAGWLAAADEAAACGLGLALRSADAGTPLPAAVVADALEAALDRECPVHWLGAHPLLGGPTDHAALALLLATRAAWDGGSALEALTHAPDPLLQTLLQTDPEAVLRARRWCRGVGADAAAVAAELAARPELPR